MGNLEALRIMVSALRYIRPFLGRYLLKSALVVLSLVPPLFAPFLSKIVVDNVIVGTSVEETLHRYPAFMRGAVGLLDGLSASEIVIVLSATSLLAVALFGFWGGGVSTVDAWLAEGRDAATSSENAASAANSYAGGFFGWLEYGFTLRLSHDLNHAYRSRLFRRLQDLALTRLDAQHIGDAIYRLMYDTPFISEVFYKIFLTPLASVLRILTVALMLTLTFGDEPLLVGVAVISGPLVLLMTLPFSRSLRDRSRASRETGARTTNTIEESVAGALVVQGLGGRAREDARFEADSWSSFSAFRRQAGLWIAMISIAGALLGFLGIIVVYEATDRLFAGALSVGDFGILFGYFGQIVGSSRAIGQVWIELQDNVVAMGRVAELLDAPADHEPEAPARIRDMREGVRFEQVGFSYPDGHRALVDISFAARPGELVALVGPAGAGKTTIAHLMARLLCPSEGRITLGGTDIMELSREAIRASISLVFQEPALFDASVAENLRLARPEAGSAEIWAALEVAGAREFVGALPEGLDSPVGRGGGRLSVGQKQRISIARALIRDTPILILDEPTASLDPATELAFVAALRRAAHDKLVVVIAHRLSTIRHADQILFIEDGRLLEAGRHAELMARADGAYRRFVDLQTSGARGDS